MLVALHVSCAAEDRVYERDLRQLPLSGVRVVLRDRADVARTVAAYIGEEVNVGDLRAVHLPADSSLVQEVEQGRLRELRPARRQPVYGPAEGCARVQVEAVGLRGAHDRREIAVVDRKCRVEGIVKRQVGLVVVPHRPRPGWVGGRDIRPGETVHRAVVPLFMGAIPGMVEVRILA